MSTQGYGILGDGTPAALMPILLGKREEELPEARRGFHGAVSLDRFPWVWNKFKEMGYATMWSEPAPEMGCFNYRMLGGSEFNLLLFVRQMSTAASDVEYDIICRARKLP